MDALRLGGTHGHTYSRGKPFRQLLHERLEPSGEERRRCERQGVYPRPDEEGGEVGGELANGGGAAGGGGGEGAEEDPPGQPGQQAEGPAEREQQVSHGSGAQHELEQALGTERHLGDGHAQRLLECRGHDGPHRDDAGLARTLDAERVQR